MLTVNDVIHVGRGFVYDPATGHLHRALYDKDTITNLIGVGPRVGEWTFHLVKKRWYERAWTLFVGSEYEHPLEFPTKDSVDAYLKLLQGWFPSVDFWITGNPLEPKSDADRVSMWASKGGERTGPWKVGQRLLDLTNMKPSEVREQIAGEALAGLAL